MSTFLGVRQVGVMVRDIGEAEATWNKTLGLKVLKRGDLPEYGLRNSLLYAGDGTFLELISPTRPGTPGARFLETRGEGLYMLIGEVKDLDGMKKNILARGGRITGERDTSAVRSCFVHPSTASGVLFELVEVKGGSNPWPDAGDAWLKDEAKYKPPMVRCIRMLAVLTRDNKAAARRWNELFGVSPTGSLDIRFAGMQAEIVPFKNRRSFVEIAQPVDPQSSAARWLERHGEGLYLLIFETYDMPRMAEHLRSTGVTVTATSLNTPDYPADFRSVWVHPRSMNGVFTQCSQAQHPTNPWPPAGPDWQSKV